MQTASWAETLFRSWVPQKRTQGVLFFPRPQARPAESQWEGDLRCPSASGFSREDQHPGGLREQVAPGQRTCPSMMKRETQIRRKQRAWRTLSLAISTSRLESRGQNLGKHMRRVVLPFHRLEINWTIRNILLNETPMAPAGKTTGGAEPGNLRVHYGALSASQLAAYFRL